jgi:hypothetical protein
LCHCNWGGHNCVDDGVVQNILGKWIKLILWGRSDGLVVVSELFIHGSGV